MSDLAADKRVDANTRAFFLEELGMRSLVVFPLVAGGQWIGVITGQGQTTLILNEAEIRQINSLTDQAATVVQNQRLFTQTQTALTNVQQSQELLRSVIDATPDWIFVKDEEHRYRLVNEGYARALHLSPEDLIGKDDLEMGYPEDIVKGNPEKGIRGFWADDLQVMDSGEPLVNPHVPVPVDGQTRIFHDIKTPLRDATGKVWGVLGFGRDMTELQQIQEALRETQQRSEAILESVSIPMVISRVSDGKILYANTPLAEMVMRPLEELIGQQTPDFYVDLVDRQNVVGQIQRQGDVNNYELRLKRSNGELIWTLLTARLFSFQGETAIITTLIDITDRKQVEEELRANQERLAEVLAVAQLGNWEFDVATQIFTFNDQFYSLFHTTAKQEGGYLMPAMDYARKFVHPDDAPLVGIEIQKAIETTDPNYSDQIEHRIIRADGSEGYILVRFRVIKDEQGRTVKTVGANQDITERKQADLERERLLTEIEATYRQFVQREWSQFLGEQHGGRWHVEHHQGGLAASEPEEANKPNGNGHHGVAISAAIKLRGQAVGNLNLEDIDPDRKWTAEEKALVETVSEQLAQTIENLRLFEDTQKRASREQLTREITDKMRASPDIDSIIETGLNELARVLNAPRTYVKLTPASPRLKD
jgi:PAS domain S-box-containing protein